MPCHRTPPAPRPVPPQPERPAILMATVDSLREPYQVLGLIEATTAAPAGITPTAQLLRLENEAVAMGADGVIGIRLSHHAVPGRSRARLIGRVVDHYGGTVLAVALGTAVRLAAGVRHEH
jgi:hypothetical protein